MKGIAKAAIKKQKEAPVYKDLLIIYHHWRLLCSCPPQMPNHRAVGLSTMSV